MKVSALPLLFLVLSGCGGEPEKPAKLTLRGEAMGTTWSVVLADPGAPDGIRERVVEAIESVEAAMSTWREDSEVSRINRMAAGEDLQLSEETAEVVACGLAVWRESGGAFDMTVGGKGDSSDIEFDPVQKALSKRGGGVTLDLSAIAKGYAVDEVARMLDAAGVENYLVEIGGELKGKGKAPSGNPWTVGIERPVEGVRRVAGTVPLSGKSIATSGNYRQRLHLIDPREGKPVEGELTAVSVIHESAMVADAWATALFVLGREKGLRLAEEKGLAVVYLTGSGGRFADDENASEAFRNMVEPAEGR